MARKWTAKAEKKYGWTYGGLEIYINDVWRYICTRNGVTAADRMTAPLEWWIKTGRANLPECKKLIEKKPYVIGRILKEKDGQDYTEIIAEIRQKIGAEI